ncbi:glycosyltransferase family 2 protein, partial [Gemmatimonas sp.]|uniref:glycosyltransferase family 2 protein n=1 Tax=Gemmatimonas sp. TaxID=1962908 RepID=UPI00391D4710
MTVPVLYLAIPAHNEVATIGVLLWRLRTVLAEFPREYEVVVYDDASTDDTATVAEQYERAMPVSVLRGTSRLGYAGAVDALLRHIAAQTRYPRRDAVLLLQGDFTDPPGIVPEFARRFEGGADLVVGERLTVADAPKAVKRLFTYAHWAMRAFVKVEGVKDLTASMRLVRISALREAIREAGSAPLVSGDSWTANTDLLLRLAPHARRVESVPMEPTFGVRMRDTRRVALSDTMGALKWAWGARGRRAVVGSSSTEPAGDERRPRNGSRRRDEPELSVERLREKVRDRDGSSGIDGEPQDARRRRGRDNGRDGGRDSGREGGRDQERGRGER